MNVNIYVELIKIHTKLSLKLFFCNTFFLYHIMLKDLKPKLNHKNTLKTINVGVFGRQTYDNLTI